MLIYNEKGSSKVRFILNNIGYDQIQVGLGNIILKNILKLIEVL